MSNCSHFAKFIPSGLVMYSLVEWGMPKARDCSGQWGGVWNAQPGFKPWSVTFPQRRLKTCFTFSSVSELHIRICHPLWASETVAGAGGGTDVRAELPPVNLSISFTQVSMAAIIQCHMSEGKSMKFIISFSTLFQFMEPASNINHPNC